MKLHVQSRLAMKEVSYLSYEKRCFHQVFLPVVYDVCSLYMHDGRKRRLDCDSENEHSVVAAV